MLLNRPENFPEHINVSKGEFVNWSKEISENDIWICSPEKVGEITEVVNWAYSHDYKVKAKGASHNWSPLNISPLLDDKNRIIFIDTRKSIVNVSINEKNTPVTVTAETGITMDALCDFLEDKGYGFNSMPAPGDLTLGGVLAINGHGTSVLSTEEKRVPGQVFGSLSNAIISLKAIVWDNLSESYILREFNRNEADISVLLTNLGRIFIVEATLQVMQNPRLLCESIFHLSADELLGKESKTSLSTFINKSGRVEVIWFPFTENPWLKVWTIAPQKPFLARKVSSPYNYPITDNIPEVLSDLIGLIQGSAPELTPLFGKTQYSITSSSVNLTLSSEIWGWSKNVLHYIKPTTLRMTANGYAILTRRSNIQNILYSLSRNHSAMLEKYAREGKYPINGPVEIRITGLDYLSDLDIASNVEPSLSALKKVADRPDIDCAIWFDVLTMPGTSGAEEFYAELEEWIYNQFNTDTSIVRVEWSKGWAYTSSKAWANNDVIRNKIPASYITNGNNDEWNDCMQKLTQFDPHGVFLTQFVNQLLKPTDLQ
ncbi:FAD binding domain-containing protein [Serratia fonticola]|uniref:FAD binding domain-containing protein n=1 Tax=Serratia fonticola TaxID=47917 RepID=A0A542BPK6_SERFO|nr:cholesterol oxidase substrate-binding domain-containing protein [Serratia fonticola]TQI80516.1 FAD binding domain-containing protein [Serratia fonticola]TVZ71956.1 FAD binding domain-containing protein [Serratia fonticola]